MTKIVTIQVFLPREAVDVWAPCEAQHIRDDVYLILDCRGEDEEVQFGEGEMVRCAHRKLSGDGGIMRDVLVAVEKSQ
jgi:hypothetical protein